MFDLREPRLNDKQTDVLPAGLINSAIDWYGALEKRGDSRGHMLHFGPAQRQFNRLYQFALAVVC